MRRNHGGTITLSGCAPGECSAVSQKGDGFMGYKYKYKISGLALLAATGLSGTAWAQNNGVVVINPATSQDYYYFDKNDNPLDASGYNPDGTIKDTSTTCPCKKVNVLNLSVAEAAAVAADPNAAKFDGKTSRITVVRPDTATGDTHVVVRTEAGVKTAEGYFNGSGAATGISANGVASVDPSGSRASMDGKGFTYTDGKGGSITMGGDPTITVGTGPANQTVINNGNIHNTGTLTTEGAATFNGGATVKGGTTTDTLHVTGPSVFDDAITVNTAGAGRQTKVTGGGATFTDASGSTTVSGGDVTSTGTVSGAKVLAGGRDVGQSLADHDATLTDHETRITHVQGQADATDSRLNGFDNWRGDMSAWRDDVNTTLSRYGSRLSSLEGWRDVATAQISNLQGRMTKVEGGVALAMASKVPGLETGKTFGISVNVADFDGTGALAGGLALRIDKNWQINASGGAGFKGGASGGTIGLVGQW